MIHELKTMPSYFNDVNEGEKKFEYRKDDRNFSIGDKLILREYYQSLHKYTGKKIKVKVIYKLSGKDASDIGMPLGYCILGIEKE